KLNREGAEPLAQEFALIDSIRSKKDLVESVAHLHLFGVDVFWGDGASPDLSDTEIMIFGIGQSGLSLPERGYYFDDDKKEIRQKFSKHVEKIFLLLGYNKSAAKNAADTVMAIETRLAQKSWTTVELRNIEPQLNYLDSKDLDNLAPNVDWSLYFDSIGLKVPDKFLVSQLDFMRRVSAIFNGNKLDDLKTYLKWWLIMRTAHLLSDDFVQEDFDFWEKTMNGNEALKPRWERCASILNSLLGEALGEEYVKKYFPPEAKEKINELVDNLTVALRHRIKELDWMTAETKKRAAEKLDAFSRKLGYPDKWKDYSALEVKKDSYVLNCLRATKFHVQDNLSKVGKPTDRTEWHMTPSTVNAYFHPLHTEIVFPAGILQPPFFDPNADDAVNYGGIGVVIGHEITHGFDDKGSQFDKDGNFKNWWTQKDRKEFDARCQKIINQFNGYEVLDGLFVNGTLTQGENIADLGGLNIAYEAYIRSLKDKPEPPKLSGFTYKQRFFLGFAQVWRSKAREEYIKKLVATDTHSPARFRILGTLANAPEFYDAFGLEEGDGMYIPPEDRVEIW
ncbi:MAG: M13 family metallopeptidase, partial [Candidatus Spechtbacterales bacterium]